MTHKERLISIGLLAPLSEDAVYQRNGILLRAKEGEKIHYIPHWCVFRRDEPFHHVIAVDEDHECQSAELVADNLYSYEAHILVDKLNLHDEEQPKSVKPWLPPVGMYGICTMEDWEEWENQHAQMKLEGLE